MKGIMNIRFIFIVAVLVVGMACQQTADPAASPPSPTADAIPSQTEAAPEPIPSPTPTPIPTATPTAPEPPAEFEATLEGDDLAKFQSLPVEFRYALQREYDETRDRAGRATTLGYLRDLPDEILPIAEILSPEALSKFEEVSTRSQQSVLLGAYAEAFRASRRSSERDPESAVHPAPILAQMVDMVHEMEFGDGEVHLPPTAEALSAEALGKLDETDPLIRRAFLLIWRNLRVPEEERDTFVTKLERALLSAPSELPPLEELGLSQSALDALEDVPNLKTFVDEYVAASLARTGAWDSVGTEYSGAMLLESLIARASTPEGSRMFAQGLLPVTTYQPPPLISHNRPVWGFWPLWAIPPFFRDMQPNDLVAEWPDHELVLSQEALAKLESLDAPLQEAFDKYWYGTGSLPNDVHWMAGIVIRWERDLRVIPFDTLPEIEELLSEDDLALYRRLPAFMQKIIVNDIAYDLLQGRTSPTSSTSVGTYHTTPEEFLEALKASVSRTVRDASEHEKRRGGS